MRTQITLQMKKASQPVEYLANAAYQAGAFYCIRTADTVVKVPIRDIAQVTETYGEPEAF